MRMERRQWPRHSTPLRARGNKSWSTRRECRLMKNYVKSTLKPKTVD
jgi:hypothetical protein